MPSVTWQLSKVRPAMWPEWVRACGGGVFHTSAGLLVDAPQGVEIYGHLLTSSGEMRGVTVGILHGCRLAIRKRHFHVPTLPALAPEIDPHLALAALKTELRAMGVAEVKIGSYDAVYAPVSADSTPPRLEYVVPIAPSSDIIAQLKTTHRRHVRRGEREGWTVRLLTGAEAEAAILGVQQSTAERAASLENGFAPVQSTAWASAIVSSMSFPETGLAVLGAYRDTSLLASILIGWAAERSFYLIGGSTPEGYQSGAAVWLHSQAISRLAAHGIRTYNLGGTAMDAANESNPGHGLYRFKTGFGISPVERRGVRWELRPSHLRLHDILAQIQHRIRR